jgi:guanylate kinase
VILTENIGDESVNNKEYNKNGLMFVISGPSGVGKGTVVKKLIENERYALSVSVTTRQPREGEIDGVHYFFKTNEEFEEMIAKESFMEHAGYCDHYYGTPKDYVFSKMNDGKDVILEIEVQGALQVKKKYPNAILVFLLPPTGEELKNRLVGRGTEKADVIEKRLKKAVEELKLSSGYDYAVVNDEVENAVARIESIVQTEHNKISENTERISQIIDELENLSN